MDLDSLKLNKKYDTFFLTSYHKFMHPCGNETHAEKLYKYAEIHMIMTASDVEHDILLSHPEKATSSHVGLLAFPWIWKVHLLQIFLQSISFAG